MANSGRGPICNLPFAIYHGSMPILVFQHSTIGGPGRLAATFRDHGFKLDIRRPDLGGAGQGVPPTLDDVEGVIILGGPMNVTEIAQLPWMQQESAFIQKAHAAGLPVIGICLGAQLIAHALGGVVGPKEGAPDLGFYQTSIGIPGQTEIMMGGIPWAHPQLYSCGQEVKTTPPGAMVLASTASTKVAAFKVGLRTYGFLFHFECDRPMAELLLKESGEFAGRANKSASGLAGELDQHYATFARVADRLTVNLASFCFPLSRRMSA